MFYVDPGTGPVATVIRWKAIGAPRGLKLSSTGVLAGILGSRVAMGTASVVIQATEIVTTVIGSKRSVTRMAVQASYALTVA